MYFLSKGISKKDLIKSYKQTIEINKSSINYWKGDETRIKILNASIEKLKRYIKELK